MSVYLKDDITMDQRRAVESLLAPGTIVASHEFVSKTEALSRFKQTFTELAGAVDGLGENPMPASFEVRLHAEPASSGIDALGATLRRASGVADVRYDRQWLNRLLSAIKVLREVGLALAAILTLAAALTVANVVRLALYARRDELDIMQLVGAPQTFIRGPFVMEGVLQGGLGSLGAVGALAVAFYAVKGRYLLPLASAVNLSSVRFLSVEVCLLLVLGGMAVGCLGGLLAARLTQS
jgi:cell division transport system permease protein